MADSTLTAIRTKVRRLTRSPSAAQLTNAEIDEYVNTFVQYDFPEHLRLSSLRETFTFFTEPYIDEYESTNPATELDNFENIYTTFHDPVYVDGKRVPLYQDRNQFYNVYPRNNTVETIGTGDGVSLIYNGTLTNHPLIKQNVLFSSIATNNTTVEVHDTDGGTGVSGALTGSGGATGTINYVTGVYGIQFVTAPADGEPVRAHYIPYEPAEPQAILFFDNKFYVRPIPEYAYRIDIEAYRRPTEVLAGSSPELEQWWQYIAVAASVKILQDRMDTEGVAQLMPFLNEQKRLVLRKTIVQQSNERVATIYTDNVDSQNGARWNNNY